MAEGARGAADLRARGSCARRLARVWDTARHAGDLYRPRAVPRVPRLLPGRGPGGRRARGDLCPAGDGFTTRDTIILILAVNVTAALGAVAFGRSRTGSAMSGPSRSTLVGWIATVVVAWWATDRATFWSRRTLPACASAPRSPPDGGSSATSRPATGAPSSSALGTRRQVLVDPGPLTYGLTSWLSRGDHRLAMLITGVLLRCWAGSARDDRRAARAAEALRAEERRGRRLEPAPPLKKPTRKRTTDSMTRAEIQKPAWEWRPGMKSKFMP